MLSEFETFEWGGQTRYKCPEPGCKFDHYTTQGVAKHWIDAHRQPDAVGGGPTLFDSDAKPVPKKIIVPDWVKETLS